MDTSLDILADLDLPRVPQQARSRQKRDALLAAAARLFEERGYDSTTADDIAAAAEVSIGTFYSYFRNKRQVFVSLFAASFEAFLALRISEQDFADNPRAVIRDLIQRGMDRHGIEFDLQKAWHEILPRDPELAAFHDKFHQVIYQQILAATRRAQAKGLLWPDLDLETTCYGLTLLLDKVWDIDPKRSLPNDADRRRLCDAVADIVYRSLFRSE